jgi:LruC domain-containing protein
MMANMERGKEIHLPDYPPTSLADDSYFGSEADDSKPDQGRYYKTVGNYPWALNIYENFSYANEKTDILDAYNHFAEWATSGGGQYDDWYLDNSGYRNSNAIYQIPEE